MADSKLSALAAETVLEGEDLLYVVVEPDGTPVSKRVPLSTLLTFLSASFEPLGGSFATHVKFGG